MANEELPDLRQQLIQLGAALGLSPRTDETSVAFAVRCTEAGRQQRLAAGVTWRDYELIKADRGSAVWGLKNPPESFALGGPRWTIAVGEDLETLAGRFGMYEDTQA